MTYIHDRTHYIVVAIAGLEFAALTVGATSSQ
jgi:hypothetical protein